MEINYPNKTTAFKILYAGPDNSGRSTNLNYIHKKLDPEQKKPFIKNSTSPVHTYQFNLVTDESLRDFNIHINFCTYPNPKFYEGLQKLTIQGADALVFIVDSQISRLDENIETFLNLSDTLFPTGEYRIPIVWQLNKRDLPEVFSAAEFLSEMDRLSEITGKRAPVPAGVVEAQAERGLGVFETYRCILDAMISKQKNNG